MNSILEKRKFIKNEILTKGRLDQINFLKIHDKDLKHLFELYDEFFFAFFFRNRKNFVCLKKFSNRLSKSAGMVKKRKDYYELIISKYLLLENFNDVNDRAIKINGIIAENRLDALLLIVEHEMIHLLEFEEFGKSSCKNKQFKDLVFKKFGHTSTLHNLITKQERFVDKDLRLGDWVSFKHNNIQLKGIVQKVNKRAVVFIPDPNGVYLNSEKKRFTKYLVPVDLLSKVDKGN